jgi:hypothetical protein
VRAGFGRMSDDMADGDETGGNAQCDPTQEANGIAYLLTGAAFLALADAYLQTEGPAGLMILDEIEDRLAEAVQSFIAEHSYEDGRPDIILHAAEKVNALLQAARSMVPRDVQ